VIARLGLGPGRFLFDRLDKRKQENVKFILEYTDRVKKGMAMGTDVFTLQAEILKALSHPTRIRIVNQLRRGERCVCEIMAELELEQSNVSQHLAVLKRAGLLGARKDGLKMMYWVRRPEVFVVLDTLRRMVLLRAEEQVRLLSEAE
jgi:ArsR family transcriptional regulator